MSRIKLVATDLDGTLFYDREHVTDRDRACLARLKQAGIPLALATGRECRIIFPALDRLQLWEYPSHIIYAGGCGMVHLPDQTEHPLSVMPPDVLRDIYFKYQNCPLSFMISQDGVLYTNRMTAILQRESRILRCEVVEVPDFGAILTKENGKLILCGEISDIDAWLPTLTADTDTRYQFHRSHDNYIDCYAHGVSKGAALQQLCKILGISPAEVLAIGDNLNDMQLLETAGFSACPGDGHPAVQAFADFVACPAYEGAVADACEHFIFADTVETA